MLYFTFFCSWRNNFFLTICQAIEVAFPILQCVHWIKQYASDTLAPRAAVTSAGHDEWPVLFEGQSNCQSPIYENISYCQRMFGERNEWPLPDVLVESVTTWWPIKTQLYLEGVWKLFSPLSSQNNSIRA